MKRTLIALAVLCGTVVPFLGGVGARAAEGVNCLAVSVPADAAAPAGASRKCTFTTNNPSAASAAGWISGTSGGFTISTTQAGCEIQDPDGAGPVTEWKHSGPGLGSLVYNDQCQYTIEIAPDSYGTVTGGQTN